MTQLDKRQRRARIDELMELTHMDSHLLQIPVRQLSGGEQRRLSLLRALSIHPQFLVLDEVTSGLDLLSADAVLQVLERYHEEFGCAYLLITHDRQTAYRISSRILELNQGVFVREAAVSYTHLDVYKRQLQSMKNRHKQTITQLMAVPKICGIV